ncbi:MAG: hypothetical protein JNK65_09860 [Deltaproteobacteria bacterium]|nr:hypothetical protein [Deltaproteobacteria bacterium]
MSITLQNNESLLGRLSSHSLSTNSSLTSFQNRVDQAIGHFSHEMKNIQA